MLARSRRGGGSGLDAWPGYVDALSTLLMVVIFVLLVFVLAQAALSVALSGSDQAIDRLHKQVEELNDMLSIERGHESDLQASVSQLGRELSTAKTGSDSLSAELSALRAQNAQATSERDALRVALQKTIVTDRATIEAKLGDLAKLDDQVRALTALRDELEKQAKDAETQNAAEKQNRVATEAALADEKRLGESARAQVALLNRQLEQVRAQLADVSHALDLAQSGEREKDVQIANLGQKLNTALVAKVEELQRYRSEFFGKLRDVLASRPGVQVVGDRFVFQSEVLFPVGSADLTPAGQDQVHALAGTIKDIAKEIPPDVNWVLRIDGHADKQRVNPSFSNWELSAQRAITVVQRLIAEGVPPEHLAATGFGEYQPLDLADTPAAYAKNRRIEIRLTDR
jgi:chemotaxis protein MotB